MQATEDKVKFGFYCNVTKTFYYFESEEEFNLMMQLMQENELEDNTI